MALARLVVVEGFDAGREFELPLRGGGVGRGDGNLVQLTDPTVSRQHGAIELRDGALCWIDETGKPRTLINGKAPTVHKLESGDEIVLGATRLAFLPVDGVAITRAASHVTMEVSSRQLMALTGHDDRARGHLATLAQLGDRLRGGAGSSLHPRREPLHVRATARTRSVCKRLIAFKDWYHARSQWIRRLRPE